jgi:hypothetical protein
MRHKPLVDRDYDAQVGVQGRGVMQLQMQRARIDVTVLQ